MLYMNGTQFVNSYSLFYKQRVMWIFSAKRFNVFEAEKIIFWTNPNQTSHFQSSVSLLYFFQLVVTVVFN